MKKFNVEIQVTVSVDSIATQLLNTMALDVTYRESIVETIVGVMLKEDRIAVLYNALNGVLPELLPINTMVYRMGYSHVQIGESEWKQERMMLEGSIQSIDEYATHPYIVAWIKINSKGEIVEEKERCKASDFATDRDSVRK